MVNFCTRPLKFCRCQHFFNENLETYEVSAILIDNLRNGVETIEVSFFKSEQITFMIFVKILLISAKIGKNFAT